jgi:hypothetical protein
MSGSHLPLVQCLGHVRSIVHFARIRPQIQGFCTIHRTLSPDSAADSRVLYDPSYTLPGVGRRFEAFVRFIVHFARIRPQILGFCTIHRTLCLVSAANPGILYDSSYTLPRFGCRSKVFVRYIVHFPRIRPQIQGFCTIHRTLCPFSAANPRVLYDKSYTLRGFDRRF